MDPRREDAIHHERFVKIICVGAGASGLCLAYKLQRSFTNYSLTIYEKNPALGGTWFENRYPGCACNVPAHNYTFTFEPKPDWSAVLAPSHEIRDYFNDFATKYNLHKHIKPSRMVNETLWDHVKGQWKVTVTDLTSGTSIQDWCHVLVHATGYLNKPQWPRIPGLDVFKGLKLHSADWDESVSLEDKRVILIGGGASGTQILPTIQSVVKNVTVFLRSPRWYLPGANAKTGKFSAEEVTAFVNSPETLMHHRKENERTLNSFFTMYQKGTVLQDQARKYLQTEMEKAIVDPELRKKLIPDFPVGCKRIVASGFPFLHALNSDNVQVVIGDAIKEVTATGCVDHNGCLHEADVLICATGFDVSSIPGYPILFNGHNLQHDWAASVNGYMGVGIPECPNSFTLAGPYTPIGNGPVVPCIEAQVDFVCAFIDKYQTEPTIHSMNLKASAAYDFKSYVVHIEKKIMVWDDARKLSANLPNNWGQSSLNWPGSTLHYMEAIREPRFEDFDFNYTGNRFAWMGDGLSQAEWDATADLAYYIRDCDDSKHLSRRGRIRDNSKSGTEPERELHRQARLTETNE